MAAEPRILLKPANLNSATRIPKASRTERYIVGYPVRATVINSTHGPRTRQFRYQGFIVRIGMLLEVVANSRRTITRFYNVG